MNKVKLKLNTGDTFIFNTDLIHIKIKNIFAIGEMFISSNLPFTVGIIEEMTYWSMSEENRILYEFKKK